ncbi:MAG: hypothetical protein ABIZ80_23210 [Bryobacteraceae bacterium]
MTELTRWGRVMLDLFYRLSDLHAWDGSLVAQTELQFERCIAHKARVSPFCWRRWRSLSGIGYASGASCSTGANTRG